MLKGSNTCYDSIPSEPLLCKSGRSGVVTRTYETETEFETGVIIRF